MSTSPPAPSFDAMVECHSRAMYAVAFRVLQDAASAEDVVQESFLSVWRSRSGYAPERGSPRNWLLSIARNRAIDALRRRPAHTDQPLDAYDDRWPAPDATEDAVLRHAERDSVALAMRTLPEPQRRVLDLAYFKGLSQREIAVRLDVPLGTVKGRTRMGLERLRPLVATDGSRAAARP